MIAVGSTNPSKVNPVREVFGRLYPDLEVCGLAVPSGVREQPIGYAETLAGASNRAQAALASGATWGVGLEGGVEFDEAGGAWLFGVVVIGHAGRTSSARSASLRLPPGVGLRVRAGEELGPVMDGLSGVRDIKRAGGTVSFLTGGLLTRADVWRQAVILALVPLLQPELYREVMA
ncbi:inosine/xanthosine triphosphatase [Deinobacterium chartae]|uniref:Probable inosine/xanthosine triphosphatase n=1 Tax=Deinobacterium chartae TaxID=521158 RepID=A0A841HZY8_9DEIO|nr:inosine/xanthosine triphosphatase [Deinobacterium chartae]